MTPLSVNYQGMTLHIPEVDAVNREYFGYCATGSYHLQSCCACGLLRYPPSSACPWCAESRSTWKPVETTGSVYSYTEVHHAIQPGLRGRTPYLVLLVELDQQRGVPTALESLRIIGNLADPDGQLAAPDEVGRIGIGSRVRMTFTPLTDGFALPQWQLLDRGTPWRADAQQR